MPYCAPDDVIARLSQTGLQYLVDDDDDMSIDSQESSLVATAIESASAEIDLALQSYIDTSEPTANPWLRDRAIDLAVERLAERKGQSVPASLAVAARRTRVWLEQVRMGDLRVPGLQYAFDSSPNHKRAGLPRVLNPQRQQRQ